MLATNTACPCAHSHSTPAARSANRKPSSTNTAAPGGSPCTLSRVPAPAPTRATAGGAAPAPAESVPCAEGAEDEVDAPYNFGSADASVGPVGAVVFLLFTAAAAAPTPGGIGPQRPQKKRGATTNSLLA